MRVFVTGATGFVGSAVVRELIDGGHHVTGLARSEAGERALASMGAAAHPGRLEDPASLVAGAGEADAVLHLAFNHDFSRFARNCEEDERAIDAMGAALEGSDRPILVTTGLALDRAHAVATEDDRPRPDAPRRSEAAAAALAARGVRASTVRLAPSTHGEGDCGFIAMLIDLARATGISAYVGDGTNLWPGVHRLDAARLYRLALEQGVGPEPYHAVAEEGVPFRAIAEVIGRRLGLPVVSKAPEEARRHFGWFTSFATMDIPTSSARTRARLGWEPRELGLLSDIDRPTYFDRLGSKAGSA